VWQKALLGVAVTAGAAGVALVTYTASGGDVSSASDVAEGLRTGLAQDASAAHAADATREAAAEWGDHLWRGGLAFVLLFCVGTALRKSLRAAVVVTGFAVIVLVGLHVAGLYEADWSGVRESAVDFAERAREKTDDVLETLSEYLVSAIAGGIGLIVGFVRA